MRSKIFRKFYSVSQSHRNKIAILDINKAYTYKELYESSLIVSRAFNGDNDGGLCIGIYLPPGIKWSTCVLGILASDNVYCSFSFDLPLLYLEKALKQINASAIITLPQKANSLLENGFSLCSLFSINEDLTLNKYYVKNGQKIKPIKKDNKVNPCCIIFTSGSTSEARAVAISEESILSHVSKLNQLITVTAEDSSLMVSSINFSMIISSFYGFILSGAKVCFINPKTSLDLSKLVDIINDLKISFLKTIPSYIARVTNYLSHSNNTLTSLKNLILSGELVPANVASSWKRLVPNCNLIITYGSTEAYSSTYYIWKKDNNKLESEFVPAGVPFPGIKLHFSLYEGEKRVKRIGISGDNLMMGYLNNDVLDCSSFELGERDREFIFYPGDLGWLQSDGNLTIYGRHNQIVKHNGFKVSLIEIEEYVNSLDYIERSIIYKDPNSGKLCCSFISNDPNVLPIKLREQLRTICPPYLIPDIFTQCKSIPLLPSGKLDRRGFNSSLNQKTLQINNNFYESTHLEKVSEILCNVLELPLIDPDTKFIDLGGDSLSFMDLVVHLEEVYNFQINLDFNSTANEIVSTIESTLNTEIELKEKNPFLNIEISPLKEYDSIINWESIMTKSTLRLEKHSESELTYAQKISLGINNSRGNYFTYIQIKFPDDMNLISFTHTIKDIISDHSSLRSITNKNHIQQEFTWSGKLTIPYRRIEHESEVVKVLSDMSLDLDLKCPPLFRWILLKTTKKHQFIWQLSHLFFDLFSVDILSKEIIRRYGYYSRFKFKYPSISLKSQSQYVGDISSLDYCENVMKKMHDFLLKYNKAVCNSIKSLQIHSNSNSKGQILLFSKKFPKHNPVSLVIASYVMALSQWLNIDTVPIRIGSDGRYYKRVKNNYSNLSGLLNDHYCIPVDVYTDDNSESIQLRISEYLNFFRENSINFDKIVCDINENDKTYIKTMKHIFSCAPLGRLTYIKANDIETIPRPLWGLSTFHKFSGSRAMKIGLYLFETENECRIQIHQFGLNNESFDLFSDILLRILKDELTICD
ncbi:AMP-binding protein [Yeosuana marina]|uniref:AMP-binding protein n=1 Tax=Yeosuana marina TaxID=1565536 RepID=UPI0030C83830